MDIGEVHFVPGIRLKSFDALLFPKLHCQRETWFRCNIPHIRLCHWPGAWRTFYAAFAYIHVFE